MRSGRCKKKNRKKDGRGRREKKRREVLRGVEKNGRAERNGIE